MRLLYDQQETNNHRFAIYHLYYNKKPGMTESIHNSFLYQSPLKNGFMTKITQATQ